MSTFAEFATRYHKLRGDLQEIEASQYAKLLSHQLEIQAQWEMVVEEQKQICIAQAGVYDVGVWHTYHTYRMSLQIRKSALEREWTLLQGQVDTQQTKLQEAYVEQEKWSHIAEDAVFELNLQASRQQQVEADDEALKRFRKADD